VLLDRHRRRLGEASVAQPRAESRHESGVSGGRRLAEDPDDRPTVRRRKPQRQSAHRRGGEDEVSSRGHG
jgi:hypothetical protein